MSFIEHGKWVKVCVKGFKGLNPIESSQHTWGVRTIISPLVQVRKLRLKENSNLPQHHTASISQSWHVYPDHVTLDPKLSISEPSSLNMRYSFFPWPLNLPFSHISQVLSERQNPTHIPFALTVSCIPVQFPTPSTCFCL